MILLITVFSITLAHGYNKGGILSYSQQTYNIIHTYLNLNGLQDNDRIVFTQLSNTSCYILLENGTIVSTGESYKLEGNQPPSTQIYQNSQLNGKNIVQVSLSDTHGIALSNAGKVYTFGINSKGQLARPASTTTNSFGEVTALPVRGSKLIAVGSVQELSFLVYEDAILVVGQCSHGLCGNTLGVPCTRRISSWEPIDLSDITNLNITNVYFGSMQIVITTADGQIYYMGDNNHQQACGSTTQYQSTPLAIPISSILGQGDFVTRIRANGYALAFLTRNSKIYYCGCQDLNYCQMQVQNLTRMDIKEDGRDIQILDFDIYYVWQILTPRWVGNYTISNRQIIKYLLPYNSQNIYRKLAQNSYGSIIYEEYRGVKITFTGGQTPQFPITLQFYQNLRQTTITCTGNAQTFFCPIQQSIMPINQKMIVSLNDSRYYPVNYAFTFTSPPITVQIPIYIQNNNVIKLNISLVDQNNQQPTNHFSLDMINKRTGFYIFQSYVFTKGLSFDIPFDELTLLDELEIRIVDDFAQASYFPINSQHLIEQPNQSYTLTVMSSHIQILQFMIGDSIYQAANYNFNLTITFPDGTQLINQNQTTTSQGQFQLVIAVQRYGNNESITLEITGVETKMFKQLNKTVYLTINTLSAVTISVIEQFQMTLSIFISMNITGIYHIVDADTNQSCYTGQITNQKNIQVILPAQAPNWNCSYLPGTMFSLLTIENTQSYFAVPMVFESSEYVNLDVFMYNVTHNVQINLKNQFSNPVSNHQLEYKVADNTTWQTITTNYNGNAQFQINLTQVYHQSRNKTIQIRAQETSQYDAIPEQTFGIAEYIMPIQLTVKFYEIFNLEIVVLNGQTYSYLPNMQVEIINSSSSVIHTGFTDKDGGLNVTFSEKKGEMFPNQEYIINVSDPTGLYSEISDTFYTQWSELYIPITYYGVQLQFKIFDGILQRFAPAVQIQINDTQQTYTRRTNDDGEVTFFVSTIVYYTGYEIQILETDLYKPYAPPKQSYSNQVILLIVHSWKQYDLKLIVYDGMTNITVTHSVITLYDTNGQIQYQNGTDINGTVRMVFSEKRMLLQDNQIYKLVINDVYGIYPEFRQNYSFSFIRRDSSFTQTFYLQIQRLFVTITNYEGHRLQNITVYLYSNKNLITTAVTDVAGTAYFYVQYNLFNNNNKLTYQINNTGIFRPITRHVGIQIIETPQLVIKKLFQRIQYIFYIYINDTKSNEQKNISSVSIQELRADNRFNFSELPNGVYNYDEIIENINKSQLADLIFYDENMTLIQKVQIRQFNKNLSIRFIEGYNLSFKYNEKYYISLDHQRKNYQNIKIQFDTTGLLYTFTINLQPVKVNFTWKIVSGLIQLFLIAIGIAMVAFASKEVTRLIRNYRDMKMDRGEIQKNGKYTSEQLIEEAQFIHDYVKYDEERFANTQMHSHSRYNATPFSKSQPQISFLAGTDDSLSNIISSDNILFEPKIFKEEEFELQKQQTFLFIKEYLK